MAMQNKSKWLNIAKHYMGITIACVPIISKYYNRNNPNQIKQLY